MLNIVQYLLHFQTINANKWLSSLFWMQMCRCSNVSIFDCMEGHQFMYQADLNVIIDDDGNWKWTLTRNLWAAHNFIHSFICHYTFKWVCFEPNEFSCQSKHWNDFTFLSPGLLNTAASELQSKLYCCAIRCEGAKRVLRADLSVALAPLCFCPEVSLSSLYSATSQWWALLLKRKQHLTNPRREYIVTNNKLQTRNFNFNPFIGIYCRCLRGRRAEGVCVSGEDLSVWVNQYLDEETRQGQQIKRGEETSKARSAG